MVLNTADVSGPSPETGCSEWMQEPAVRFVAAEKYQTCPVRGECGSFRTVKLQFMFVTLVLPGGYQLVPQQRIKIILEQHRADKNQAPEIEQANVPQN